MISLKAHLSKPISLKPQLKIPIDLPSTCHGQNEEATSLKLSALRTIVISSGLGISDGLAQHINAQITPSKTGCYFVSIVTNQCPNHDIEMRVHYHIGGWRMRNPQKIVARRRGKWGSESLSDGRFFGVHFESHFVWCERNCSVSCRASHAAMTVGYSFAASSRSNSEYRANMEFPTKNLHGHK